MFFFATLVSVAVHIEVLDLMKYDVCSIMNTDFLITLFEVIRGNNDFFALFVGDDDDALLLSSIHESLPEVSLVLE